MPGNAGVTGLLFEIGGIGVGSGNSGIVTCDQSGVVTDALVLTEVATPSMSSPDQCWIYLNTSGVLAGINSSAGNCVTGSGGGVISVSGTANEITSSGGATPVLSIPNPFIAPGSVAATTTLSAGATPPTACTPATGCVALAEATTAGTPTSAVDYIRANGTLHAFECSLNGGAETACAPTIPNTAVSGHLVTWGTWPAMVDGGAVPVGTVTSIATTAPLAGGPITSTGTLSITGAAGQVLAGATPAFTATPVLGTDNSVAGTLQLANGSANAHTIFSSAATTTNTIAGFTAVPTNGHLVTCTVVSTTCTLTDGGAVPSAGANTALSNLAAVAINTALLPGTTNSIALGSGSFYWSNLFSTAVNCGIAGTTGCVFTGAGATSGTATITWPAVSGTATNPIAFSNNISVPAVNGNGYGFGATAATTLGVAYNNGVLALGGGSGETVDVNDSAAALVIYPSIALKYYSSGFSLDTSLSRPAAGVLSSGKGTVGSTTGGFEASYFQSAGTKFTASGCTNSATVGGATAGKFASGTTGTCTVTITMGDSDTATNGWACFANDLTTTTNLWAETATTTTTATIAGTTVTADVVNFGCMAY
jgi:hypothetical protein